MVSNNAPNLLRDVLMIFMQDISGEMISQLLLDRLHDDVVEVVDTVLTLNDVCHVLMVICDTL